jgi:PRC-barrel domain
MKTKTTIWALGAFAVLGAAVALHGRSSVAQVVERANADVQITTDRDADHARHTCKASDVIGMDVRGVQRDDNIGSINDVVIGHDGRVKYLAVSFGGFLGMGDKLFAVPFEAIDWVKTDDDAYARIDVTEETLKEKKGFNQDNWPEEADRSFTIGNLRRHAAAQKIAR